MFHQVRVEYIIQLYYTLFILEEYEHLRENASHIAPYRQTQSKRVSMYRHAYTDADAYTA